MHDQLSIPACFSAVSRDDEDPTTAAVTRSGQNVYISVYRTKIADKCRLVTVTWCRNLLLHGLSVSISDEVTGGDGIHQQQQHQPSYTCKVELNPWFFWRKSGSRHVSIEGGRSVDVVWDLKSAKFTAGETEPLSEYYVAVACEGEVALLLGDMKDEAYKKTRCRPALIDPILVSRKEHVFGKKRFITRSKFHEKGRSHEIVIECKAGSGSGDEDKGDLEMEIRFDGRVAVQVKHLQWKFRGNVAVRMNRLRVEVYWDVHNWLFNPGLRHALFIFKPIVMGSSSMSANAVPPISAEVGRLSLPPCAAGNGGLGGGNEGSEFCLFLYAWKVE